MSQKLCDVIYEQSLNNYIYFLFYSGAQDEVQEVLAAIPDYDYDPDEDKLDLPEIVTSNQTDQIIPGQSLSIKCRVKKLYDNQVRIYW